MTMGRRKKPKPEEPECCFSCRSYSARQGKRAFGYCFKLSTTKDPRDICELYKRSALC